MLVAISESGDVIICFSLERLFDSTLNLAESLNLIKPCIVCFNHLSLSSFFISKKTIDESSLIVIL